MASQSPPSPNLADRDDGLSFSRSAAGEEDPGASLDIGHPLPGSSDQPAGNQGVTGATPPLAPGDEAAPGTPGTGENICPACGGTGRREGVPCKECEGTGRVTVGIGGA